MKAEKQAVDPFKVGPALLVKLGSYIVHIQEAKALGGHEFDWAAAKTIEDDAEVKAWLGALDAQGFLPKKRIG